MFLCKLCWEKKMEKYYFFLLVSGSVFICCDTKVFAIVTDWLVLSDLFSDHSMIVSVVIFLMLQEKKKPLHSQVAASQRWRDCFLNVRPLHFYTDQINRDTDVNYNDCFATAQNAQCCSMCPACVHTGYRPKRLHTYLHCCVSSLHQRLCITQQAPEFICKMLHIFYISNQHWKKKSKIWFISLKCLAFIFLLLFFSLVLVIISDFPFTFLPRHVCADSVLWCCVCEH